MFIAILAALAVAAAPPTDTVSPDPSTLSAPDADPVKSAQDNLDRAEQIYAQSCSNRAYGAYDDLCEQLSIQMRTFRVDLDKAQRAALSKGARTTPK